MNIVFMGTPDFAVESLKSIYEAGHNILAVVSQPDKPSGRGMKLMPTPTKAFALEKNIKVYQPERVKKNEEFIEELKKLNPDVMVVVAYGKILPEEILNIPKYGCVNVHGSLLPKYRGAAPIQWSIINGDKETGICTMVTELGLDCGDVCMRETIAISDSMNCMELFEKISEDSPQLLEKTLIDLYNGDLIPTPQCEDGVCMANKLTKEETQIDWNKSACEIHNLVRGIYKAPSAYFEYDGKIVKVLETRVVEDCGECGEFVKVTKEGIQVGCGKDCLLLVKVKPEGKGEMFARDWYNGLRK